MKNFVEYIAKRLVNTPSTVKIYEHNTDNEYKLEIHVPPNEIAKVIGKHGVMAESLRTICNFHSSKILKKPNSFRIIEDGCTH